MPMGQLNPLRTLAPESTVTTGALANILGQQNEALGNIGKNITEVGNVAEAFGQDVNTRALNDLIASGQLEGLSESGIQQLVAQQAGGSRQNQAGTGMLQNLFGEARGRDTAETERANALEKLMLEAQTDKDLERFKQKGSMDELLKTIGSQEKIAGEGLSTDLFKQDRELEAKKKQQAHEEKLLNMELGKGSGKTGLETGGIKKILAETDPVEKKARMVEAVLEDKNLFQDAKFDEQTDLLVKGAVQKAMETPEGQSAFATGNRDIIMGVIKKNLPSGSFASVASGLGALNPFGRHFLDTNKQVFVPKGQ